MERREHRDPCGSSVKIRVHPWQKKHPASVAQHSGFQGIFTPHPRPLSPASIAVYTNRHILLECGNAKDCHQNVSRAPPP